MRRGAPRAMDVGVIARRPLAGRAADAAIPASSRWPRDCFGPAGLAMTGLRGLPRHPPSGNRSRGIGDPVVRDKVRAVVTRLVQR